MHVLALLSQNIIIDLYSLANSYNSDRNSIITTNILCITRVSSSDKNLGWKRDE